MMLMNLQAIPIILLISEKYPLQEYQSRIEKSINVAVEEQITQKNTRAPQSTGGMPKKRDAKDANHDTSLRARLPLLKSRGVRTVTEHLYARLHNIGKTDAEKAKSDRLKAAAQRRLLLPDTDECTVQSLMQYIYHGTVHYESAEQLYALLNLSTELGVETLAEICLSKLSNAATDTIQGALASGIPIQSLLGYGSSCSTDNVLAVIFINVFNDKNPPKRLMDLVIDTLADSLDMDLWGQLRDVIGHAMALQLIEAMIVRQQTKAKHSTSVKFEGNGSATEQMRFVPSNKY